VFLDVFLSVCVGDLGYN